MALPRRFLLLFACALALASTACLEPEGECDDVIQNVSTICPAPRGDVGQVPTDAGASDAGGDASPDATR
jgi:hypothetical protein